MTATTPASDDVLAGDPPPDVAPPTGEHPAPTEHVIVEDKPKRAPRVFTAVTASELDAIVDEPAPVDAADVDKPAPEPTTAAVAVREQVGPLVVAEQDWPHDFMDFEGDRLAVRLPDERALTGFALSVGKYIPTDVQNDMVSLFMNRHMSPDSYGQVMARMMDPDDATYTTRTVGQLFNSIVKAAGEVRAEEAKAAKDAAAKPK